MTHENEEQGGFLGPVALAYNALKLVPVRRRFSNADEAFIQAYGGFPINKITVCRTPISRLAGTALNVITYGKWERAMAKYGYDKMFHLFMLIDILDTNKQKIITCILQKHDTPRCSLYNEPLSNDTEVMYVEKQYTGNLRTMLQTTQAKMGTAFWVYDGFKNNCQDFLLNVLGSNGLLSPRLIDFIKQPIKDIANELPSYTAGVNTGITDTIRRVRTLFGRGLNFN